MIIGITGTLGAGKGEEWVGAHSARPCQIFFEANAEKKISTRCTVPVRKGVSAPVLTQNTYKLIFA